MPIHLARSAAATAGALLACLSAKADFSVGVGVGHSSDPLITDVHDPMPYPIVTYEGERISAGLGELSYKWIENPTVQVKLTANVRTSETDDPIGGSVHDEFDEAFAGIDRSTAADLGTEIRLTRGVPVVLRYQRDVSTAEAGSMFSATMPLKFYERGPLAMTASFGATWIDDDWINYNYGVRPEEARQLVHVNRRSFSRAAYQADDGALNPFAGLSLDLSMGKWLLQWSVNYQRLDEAVTDSPLVEDDYVANVGLTVLYKLKASD